MDDTLALDIGTGLLALSLVPITLFILFYGLRSNWTSTRVGRIMMSKSAAIWATIALVSWLHFYGTFTWFEPFVILIPAMVLTAYIAHLVSLLKIQSRQREQDARDVIDAERKRVGLAKTRTIWKRFLIRLGRFHK